MRDRDRDDEDRDRARERREARAERLADEALSYDVGELARELKKLVVEYKAKKAGPRRP